MRSTPKPKLIKARQVLIQAIKVRSAAARFRSLANSVLVFPRRSLIYLPVINNKWYFCCRELNHIHQFKVSINNQPRIIHCENIY